jgi:hypothetical protein
LRDPIEHDPEQDDRHPCGEAFPELLPSREPGDDVVA